MTRALVFDSGVGGLTIADELRKAAPDWIVDYAADSGFFPYGVKTDEELRERLPRSAPRWLDVAKPDVLVIACNTASTLSLDGHPRARKVPVVGTVPAIKPAAEQTKTGVIGILATPGTVRRAYLDDLERKFASGKIVMRRGHGWPRRHCRARGARPGRSIRNRWRMP
jgi:glutamate racemase